MPSKQTLSTAPGAGRRAGGKSGPGSECGLSAGWDQGTSRESRGGCTHRMPTRGHGKVVLQDADTGMGATGPGQHRAQPGPTSTPQHGLRPSPWQWVQPGAPGPAAGFCSQPSRRGTQLPHQRWQNLEQTIWGLPRALLSYRVRTEVAHTSSPPAANITQGCGPGRGYWKRGLGSLS